MPLDDDEERLAVDERAADGGGVGPTRQPVLVGTATQSSSFVRGRGRWAPVPARRPDIQGLRALAVLAVVAYHAGLPVPGGFVGVDIFFVISGYVITNMLRREWDATGRIRLGAFYWRRFRRLMPALSLVVTFTLAASALLLSPFGPQKTAVETGLGSLGLVANWVVSSTTGAYFDAPARTNPFLHTWTLSVEEQFYLVFPTLLVGCWVLARRRHTAAVRIVLAVAAISFLAALTRVDPFVHSWLFGFYSPLPRAWEFAAGALLALGEAPLRTRRFAVGAGAVGMAAVAASLWTIDSATPFPSAWTLLPVAGASLLVAAGRRPNGITRTLSLPPLVRIGDWSYSIYLWHWPLIVFAAVLWPDSPRTRLAAAMVALVPALVSYVYVEQPLRSFRPSSRARVVLLGAVVLTVPLAVDGALAGTVAGVWSPGHHQNLSAAHAGAIGQDAFFRYIRSHFVPCTPLSIRDTAPEWMSTTRCWQSRQGPLDLALIGDSHAENVFVGLAEARPALNVGYYIVDDRPTLRDQNFARIVRTVAAARRTRTVVVSVFWQSRAIHEAELRAVLDVLARAHKQVFVTDDLPSFGFDPFQCKYRRAVFMRPRCTMSRAEFDAEYAQYAPPVVAAVRSVRGARLLRTAAAFCHGTTCSMLAGRRLLYRDPYHVNVGGSRFLAARMLADPSFTAALGSG